MILRNRRRRSRARNRSKVENGTPHHSLKSVHKVPPHFAGHSSNAYVTWYVTPTHKSPDTAVIAGRFAICSDREQGSKPCETPLTKISKDRRLHTRSKGVHTRDRSRIKLTSSLGIDVLQHAAEEGVDRSVEEVEQVVVEGVVVLLQEALDVVHHLFHRHHKHHTDASELRHNRLCKKNACA